MAIGALPAALRELDPARRALLDLSVRRGVADDEIATLLRIEREAVARRREEALEELSRMTGAEGPDDIRSYLAALPERAWAMEAAARPPDARGRREAAPASTTKGAPGDEAASAGATKGAPRDDAASTGGTKGAPGDEATTARAAKGAEGEQSPSVAALSGARPARRRRRLPGPAAVSTLALLALIGVVTLLLATGGDDGGGGESDPSSRPPRGDAQQGPSRPNRPARDEAKEKPPPPAAAEAPLEPLGEDAAEARGTGRLRIQDGRSVLELTIGGLASPEGRYQVWLYNSVSDAVSLGSFGGRRIELAAPLPDDLERYRYVDVSLEPDDGNENHSGQSLLRLETDKLAR